MSENKPSQIVRAKLGFGRDVIVWDVKLRMTITPEGRDGDATFRVANYQGLSIPTSAPDGSMNLSSLFAHATYLQMIGQPQIIIPEYSLTYSISNQLWEELDTACKAWGSI